MQQNHWGTIYHRCYVILYNTVTRWSLRFKFRFESESYSHICDIQPSSRRVNLVLDGGKINYFKRFRIANCWLSFQKPHISVSMTGGPETWSQRRWNPASLLLGPGDYGLGVFFKIGKPDAVCVCDWANFKWRMTTAKRRVNRDHKMWDQNGNNTSLERRRRRRRRFAGIEIGMNFYNWAEQIFF